MIRLNLSPGPRRVELLPGLILVVAPVTTAVMAAARADGGMAGLDEASPREELAVAMAKALARRVVLDWEGVGNAEGKPLPVTPEGVDALMDLWPIFEAFQREVLAQFLLLESEKNGSAPLPNGISAGATSIADPAAAFAANVPPS